MFGSDWLGVLVLSEGFVVIAGNVAIDVSLRVFPGEMYAAKERTR